MVLHRTILALLLSLTMAFAPVASVAMAKSCAMTTEMTAGSPADCPCHNSMPNCGAMPQCQTASGCASQCFASCGLVPSVTGQTSVDLAMLKIAGNERFSSRSITPPAPPPRV